MPKKPRFITRICGIDINGLVRTTLTLVSVLMWWHGIDGGASAMTELLTRPDLPTAVFTEFDELAVGALWALRRAGLRVPQDVSVVGIDNAEMAEFVDLTTVAQDVGAQGRAAARMLRQLLGDEPGTPAAETVLHPARLLLQGKTCPPASARRPAVSVEDACD
ncbi:substrate-binding domain-containing protein [Micropruina sp.]|uniref:substrate-binding domain-containing protein n=1 Tax=Micropruina sp. TaxID=2737536 RepID=UPI0039E358E4